MAKPRCFVLMSFGTKPTGAGTLNFDAVHRKLIAAAIKNATP